MTPPVPFAEIVQDRIDDQDELTHLYCCNEDLALCGRDISQLPTSLEPGQVEAMTCVVCQLLTNCGQCGGAL